MYDDLKERLIDAFKYMEVRGLNYGRAGNISVFIRDKAHILVTPSSVPKAKLTPSDILVVDLEGRTVEGVRKPTIELPLHLTIYRNLANINAVIHAHGIYSTVLAITREPLPPLIEEALIYIGGEVKVAEFAPAGSKELADNAIKALNGRKAVILANHGVVTCGKDLDEALEILELVERLSKIYILAKQLGRIYFLPENIIEIHKKTFLKRSNLAPSFK